MTPVCQSNLNHTSQLQSKLLLNNNTSSKDSPHQWNDSVPEDGRCKIVDRQLGTRTNFVGQVLSQSAPFSSSLAKDKAVFAERCSNPEPSEPGSTTGTADSTITAARGGGGQTTVQVVVPKVVRVSPLHPTAIRFNAIMTGEEAKRRKEAQVEFPRTTHIQTAQPPLNNSHNGGSRGQRHPPHQQQQQQQPHHNMRASPAMSQQSSVSTKGRKTSNGMNSHSSLGGGSLNSDAVSSLNIHPTPLFQRLVSEEVQELKAYARIIENQNRRLAELERVHGDLEVRLEVESNRRMELEKTLEERERNWAEQIEVLEEERDQTKNLVKLERTKNARLMDQVVRKDQDIHRMLQRKVSGDIHNRANLRDFPLHWWLTDSLTLAPQYDHPRNDGVSASIRNARGLSKSPVLTNGESPKTSSADLKNHSQNHHQNHNHHKSPFQVLNASTTTGEERSKGVVSSLTNFFGIG